MGRRGTTKPCRITGCPVHGTGTVPEVLVENDEARAMIVAAWDSRSITMDWLSLERCLRIMLADDRTTLAQIDEAVAAFTKRGHVRTP